MAIRSNILFFNSLNKTVPQNLFSCDIGSFNFNNNYLSIPPSSDWSVGTGDFCVEWWQYQTQLSPPCCSRVFDIGEWPSESLGISIENGRLIAWVSESLNGNIELTNILNQWVHFAFIRENGMISVYQDGVRVLYTSAPDNVNDTINPLTIGYGSGMQWYGNITNFRFVKGYSVYDTSNSTIQVPTKILEPIEGTKLLLLARNEETFLEDSSGLNKTVTSVNNVIWDSSSPELNCIYYRYIKWTFTNKKVIDGEYIQLGDINLLKDNFLVSWNENATISNPNGSNPNGEEPELLLDNNVFTKWLDFNFSINGQSIIIIDNIIGVSFDCYYFNTANDYPSRDPISWTLEGSNDNENWVLLDSVSNSTITNDRNTQTQNFCLP